MAAKGSHGNFLNRNCIMQSEFISSHLGTKSSIHSIVNEKQSTQNNTLITNMLSNYYKGINMNCSQNIMLVNDNHEVDDSHHQHHSEQQSNEDATQQLWYGGDTQSNLSSAPYDLQNSDWLDYPTRFYTQLCVLSSRNFKEAKFRMLSRLNWFQTIGLALMTGAIWFNIPRTEEYLHDLQGWMFFSQTYWMLFALFGALNTCKFK